MYNDFKTVKIGFSVYNINITMKSKKLICVVTGKKLFATQDYYTKKLSKYDDDENKMLEHYMCKEAKRLIQQGYSVENTRNMLSVDLDKVGEVSAQVVDSVVNENRKIPRVKTGQAVTSMNMSNHQTDNDVRKFLETITSKK